MHSPRQDLACNAVWRVRRTLELIRYVVVSPILGEVSARSGFCREGTLFNLHRSRGREIAQIAHDAREWLCYNARTSAPIIGLALFTTGGSSSMRPTDEIYDFVAIGELADTTKQFIYHSLAYNVRHLNKALGMERVGPMVMQQAREYLGRVREGFVLSVRTADVTSKDELGFLLERVMLDWEMLSAELGLSQSDSPQMPGRVEAVRDQLLAFGMAAVALGMLPRLPSEEVTFPKSYRTPATYADIPVPTTPAAMLQRIEELEKMIWQIASQDLIELAERRYDPLRRTYGFFESSAWLTRHESSRFGVNPRNNSLL